MLKLIIQINQKRNGESYGKNVLYLDGYLSTQQFSKKIRTMVREAY